MLKVKDNYLYENNQPFFWLGDTAWELFKKLDFAEIKSYLDNRFKLGFNVIQVVYSFSVLEKLDNDYLLKVEKTFEYAAKLKIYIALFPLWGRGFKEACNIWSDKEIINYYLNIAKLYNKYSNLIWVLGGDILGSENLELFNQIGKSLKEFDSSKLVTFHPFGRTGSYLWFNNETWLDFNMYQSGHRRYDQLDMKAVDSNYLDEANFGESAYKYVIKNFTHKPNKPIVDGEPSYEGVVQGLHDSSQPYWEAKHIRRYAYFGVLEGAFGFTYGNGAVIQFNKLGNVGSYGVKKDWHKELNSEGAKSLKYLKELCLELDYTQGKAHPELVLEQYPFTRRISCFAGKGFIICYSYKGDIIKLNLEAYQAKTLKAYWFNPENGERKYIGKIDGFKEYSFGPQKRTEESNDWVLILKE